jgi:hypothetical protein
MKGRRNKYRAKPCTIDGHRFASQAEGLRYTELRMLQTAGRISDLRLQPRYVLAERYQRADGGWERAVTYVADFAYLEAGREIVEDVKGVETQVWRMKRRLFLQQYPALELRTVKRKR